MSKRPVRDVLEKGTYSIPERPLKIVGKGRVAGMAGYFGVSAVNSAIPLDGLNVGFSVRSHTIDKGSGHEVHNWTINAVSRDVALAVVRVRSPASLLDATHQDVEIQSIEKVTERRWATTWNITAQVEE